MTLADRVSLPVSEAEFPANSHMTYGPAWAVVASTIMKLAGTNFWIAGLLFKTVLVSAWIGCLVLLRRLTAEQSVYAQCMAIAVWGWLPLTLSQGVVEGHNDVAMVFFMLLWLHFLTRQKPTSVVWLALATLCKYAAFPLVMVDAIGHLRDARNSVKRYALMAVLGGLVGLAGIALFYRSPDFFAGLKDMKQFHFLSPRAFIKSINPALDPSLGRLVRVFFAGLAAWLIWEYWRRPSPPAQVRAAFAAVAALLFAVASHVWPWYLLWLLALGALQPNWWFVRFTIGLALACPFLLALRAIGTPTQIWLGIGVIPLYVFAFAWCVATKRWNMLAS